MPSVCFVTSFREQNLQLIFSPWTSHWTLATYKTYESQPCAVKDRLVPLTEQQSHCVVCQPESTFSKHRRWKKHGMCDDSRPLWAVTLQPVKGMFVPDREQTRCGKEWRSLSIVEHNTVKSQTHGFLGYRNYLAGTISGTLHGNKASACFDTFLLHNFHSATSTLEVSMLAGQFPNRRISTGTTRLAWHYI